MDSAFNRTISIWLPRVAILIALGIVLYFAGETGMRWRHWVWDTTAPIRFVQDIDRGYDWGRQAASEGYLNQYEKMQVQKPKDENLLDYGPLRLGVMTLWGKWSLIHFPNVKKWHEDHSYALTAPVLRFNLGMEILGLIAAFFLTRLWAVRGHRLPVSDSPAYFFRGWIPGIVAVLLLWFNPAIVISAYGWPTWDLWIIPIYLLAALLASVEWWFTAGMVLGIGVMFKGQQLVAVPVFVTWALVLGRPLQALRLGAGVVMAIALIVSPWLVTYIPPDQLAAARAVQAQYKQAWQVPDGTFKLARVVDYAAIVWIACMLLASIGGPWIAWITLERPDHSARRLLASPWFWRAIASIAIAVLVGWPWLLKSNHDKWMMGLFAISGLIVAVLLVRPRGIALVAGTATATALLLCMSLFHGSSGWYDCGIRFGTVHWPRMTVGMADNLPGIMVADFNWPMNDLTAPVTIPAHFLLHYPATDLQFPIRTVLLTLFWITLGLSCMGVGMQARSRSPRVLIALTAPWLMFFCFPPQIHERYLIFAAGVSCICAGFSVGMTLLGVFLSLVTFLMTLHVMLISAYYHGGFSAFGKVLAQQFPNLFDDTAATKLLRFANGTYPDLGYAVILCGLIFLYFSLALGRRNPGLGGTSDTGLVS